MPNDPPQTQPRARRTVLTIRGRAVPIDPKLQGFGGVCLGWVPYEITPFVSEPLPAQPDLTHGEDWRRIYHEDLEHAREVVTARAKLLLRELPVCEITGKRLVLFAALSHDRAAIAAWLLCDHCNERRIRERLWDGAPARPIAPSS